MAFSNSLHANAAPLHFERIAKNLQTRRNCGDFSTCDVKIELKNGYDMVHSMVVCAHSTVLSEALETQRHPYQPFDMKDFEANCVKRVFDWMYSGEIRIPEAEIADVLAVASYLRVTMLQRQIEQKIRNHSGSPILALNIASARAFSVMDDTMSRLVNDLCEKVAVLKSEEVLKLSINSVIAVMAAVIPMQKKVPLINMVINWIKMKKPEKETINAIVGSLVMSDITFDTLYAIRYSLKQYLTNTEVASKSQLTLSPSGTTIRIQISTNKSKVSEKSSSVVTPPPPQGAQFHRTRSEISALEKIPDPFITSRQQPAASHRTLSEIESIKKMSDPFENSSRRLDSASSTVLCRNTNDGFPKYFTRSEVENLQNMTDPFCLSDKEKSARIEPIYKPASGFSDKNCTAKYPGWSNDIIEKNKAMYQQKKNNGGSAKYTASEVQLVKNMPDPFVQSTASPVILKPAVGMRVSSNYLTSPGNGLSGNPAAQSFSGHSLTNNNYINKIPSNPKGVVSLIALVPPSESSESMINPKMAGIKKTDSEILEIQALPSIQSASFHTAKTSNLSAHDGSQKQQTPKKMPRSQYLYPN